MTPQYRLNQPDRSTRARPSVRGLKRLAAMVIVVVWASAALFGSEATAEPRTLEDVRRAWEVEHQPGTFEDQMAYQRHFRALFDALDDSDGAIVEAMLSPDPDSFSRWGLSLTPAEHAELLRRNETQKQLPKLAEAAVGSDWSEELVEGLAPDKTFGAFAGRWIDQLDGGRLVVALVESHPAYESAIARIDAERTRLVNESVLMNEDVRIETVTFTADQLYAVNRAFGEKYLDDPSMRRSAHMSASINEVHNRVDVYAEENWAREAKEFASAYPAGLVELTIVSDGALDFSSDLNPSGDWGAGNWHAGAKMQMLSGTGNLGTCTWGASARTASYTYLVTVAHCLGYDSVRDIDYDDNSIGTVSFWNDSLSSTSRRGARALGASSDVFTTPNAHTYVVAYHGTRGDLARLMVSNYSLVNDLNCYLENLNLCGRDIARRETTTETEVGDVKCAVMPSDVAYRCTTLYSNDAIYWGYDFIRQMNTTNETKSQGGDSGTGWKESTLLSGITRGHGPGPLNDTYFTHAYYIEASSYLDAIAVCGTTGACSN